MPELIYQNLRSKLESRELKVSRIEEGATQWYILEPKQCQINLDIYVEMLKV